MKNADIIQVLETYIDSLRSNCKKIVDRKTYTDETMEILQRFRYEIDALCEAVEILRCLPELEQSGEGE